MIENLRPMLQLNYVQIHFCTKDFNLYTPSSCDEKKITNGICSIFREAGGKQWSGLTLKCYTNYNKFWGLFYSI